MLDMLVFSVIFTGVQIVAGLVVVKLLMSKKFLKKYTKMTMDIAQEITDEMDL